MRLSTALILIFCVAVTVGLIAWRIDLLRSYIKHAYPINSYKLKKENITTKKELNDQCVENKLLLQLAELYVISPERIVILLTKRSLKKTCEDVHYVLQRINYTLAANETLPPENLYVRLYAGLDYFNSFVCLEKSSARRKYLLSYHHCIQDLRDDLLECEGPPDWFEKTNKAAVCQYYNDIVNCYYVKAAMLCGLKQAHMLRIFSSEIIKRVVMFKCKVSRSLPHVDDPIPSAAAAAAGGAFSICIYLFYTLRIYNLYFLFMLSKFSSFFCKYL